MNKHIDDYMAVFRDDIPGENRDGPLYRFEAKSTIDNAQALLELFNKELLGLSSQDVSDRTRDLSGTYVFVGLNTQDLFLPEYLSETDIAQNSIDLKLLGYNVNVLTQESDLLFSKLHSKVPAEFGLFGVSVDELDSFPFTLDVSFIDEKMLSDGKKNLLNKWGDDTEF